MMDNEEKKQEKRLEERVNFNKGTVLFNVTSFPVCGAIFIYFPS